ncbi:hypothetical protein Q7P37_003214 [Cladosporium fusiforme]
MLEAIRSLATLRWRSQPPQFRPLPGHVERVFVKTPSGDLELLISRPEASGHQALPSPPVFFVHGGYGSAGVWLDWMDHLRKSGYTGVLYACSLRNHGGSYAVPFYRMVWRTSFDSCAEDLLACIRYAQRDARSEHVAVVGHSSGGGLLQYLLAKNLFQARALCLLDAIPHFGSYGVYWNWFKTDPWFPLRGWLHLQHPTSPLSSDRLVQQAFFGRSFPATMVAEFRRWMPAYESMGWPLGMFGEFWAWCIGRPRWLDAKDIVRNISRSQEENLHAQICIMVGSEDMMIDVDMCRSQVAQYREALISRASSTDSKERSLYSGQKNGADFAGIEGIQAEDAGGVHFVVIEGAGHHSQNDVQRDRGARALQRFLEQV